MSPAKRKELINYPSIFTSLLSELNLLNSMLLGVAVNSLGEMMPACLMPLLVLIFSLSV